ncbi:hypothetical protein MRB53_030865 [Persea americana]|uniref:Uncharacterized protein n=1 Tax=Persea americana TaxID=3435 RepID=A0ACC2KMJ2_PERAE|nr:hypothetical protein MRB53_030865 [Persea americana]
MEDVDDPTPGLFSVGIDPQTPRQLVMWRGSETYWRDGVWETETYAPLPRLGCVTRFANDEEISFLFTTIDNSRITRFMLTPTGSIVIESWDGNEWETLFSTLKDNCNAYDWCGRFGSCDHSGLLTVCNCLEGFRPKFRQQWEMGIWSGGCVREMSLDCGKRDGFHALKGVKLPDHSITLGNISLEACPSECQNNCSCTAYSYTNISGWGSWKCLIWVGDLIDIKESFETELILNIRLAGSEPAENSEAADSSKKRRHLIAVVLPLVTIGMLIICALGYFLWKRLRNRVL